MRSSGIRVRIAGIEFANRRSLVTVQTAGLLVQLLSRKRELTCDYALEHADLFASSQFAKPAGASGLHSFDSPRQAPKITTREVMHHVL
ncbi:hypothetical protein ACIHIX_46565 [Streptomyces sp. NPDC051913]|uniref:hypothetical protein n=1 Tax=Streptomyces sp. NPDC051913 TaxID=3365676 RepID=UPI0037D2FE14